MKIAFFLDSASTGGWRYVLSLMQAMKDLGEEVCLAISDDFSVKLNDEYLKQAEKIGIDVLLVDKFYCFKKYKKKFKNKLLDICWNSLRRTRHVFISLAARKRRAVELSAYRKCKISDFDIVFYPWPYTGFPHHNAKNIFFIPHDFIMFHFFGFTAIDTSKTRNECLTFFRSILNEYFQRGTAIVTTPYIRNEALRFGEVEKCAFKRDVRVIYHAKFSKNEEFSAETTQNTLSKYGLVGCKYIHLANNNMLHKNSGAMFSAMWYIAQKYPDIKLVCTGADDDVLLLKINNHIYADIIHDKDSTDWDAKSLGLLPHSDMVIIMKNALCVVNSSFCEAGAGSAMDAWELGVPMVMSDIPPFRDQLEFYRTKAELFDPRNSKSLADAVLRVLENPDKAHEMASTSQEMFQRYTWTDVARQYIDAFRQEVNGTLNK